MLLHPTGCHCTVHIKAGMSRRQLIKSITALGALGLLRAPLHAQSPIVFSEEDILCNINGASPRAPKVMSFASSQEAQSIVGRICRSVRLKQNFEILAGDVSNAEAIIKGGRRYIIYSELWVSEMQKASKSEWAGIALMAHECAHHFNNDFHEASEPHLRELSADLFAGSAVAKLGGSMDDALALFRTPLFSDEGSASHPPRRQRLEAVAVGWRTAKETSGSAQSFCRNDWVGQPFEAEGQTCRQFRSCEGGLPVMRTGCIGTDGRWYY